MRRAANASTEFCADTSAEDEIDLSDRSTNLSSCSVSGPVTVDMSAVNASYGLRSAGSQVPACRSWSTLFPERLKESDGDEGLSSWISGTTARISDILCSRATTVIVHMVSRRNQTPLLKSELGQSGGTEREENGDFIPAVRDRWGVSLLKRISSCFMRRMQQRRKINDEDDIWSKR